MAKLERERIVGVQRISIRMDALKRELDCERAPEPILPPVMAKMHVHEVQKLIKTLNEPDPRKEAAGLFRGRVDRFVLTPDATKTRLVIELEGDLAGILAMSETRHSAEPSVFC